MKKSPKQFSGFGALAIVLGIISTIVGIMDFISEGELLYGHYSLIFGGALLIFIGYRQFAGEKHSFMCTECLTVSFRHQITENRCPHCGGTVEQLDGFYDRHPNLRNERTE